MAVRALQAGDVPAARAILCVRPHENVFLEALLDQAAYDRLFVACADRSSPSNPRGPIRALGYFGAQFVFAAKRPEDVIAFAKLPEAYSVPRMIVAPRALAETFWRAAAAALPSPRLVRASQPVFALEARDLRRTGEGDLDVAPATLDELEEVTVEAARMSAAELGAAPAPIDPVYRARLRALVEGKDLWRARRAGRLVFQCYLGARSAASAQVQGVWCPPLARGRGDATRAFGTICARLLEHHPALSLYVNSFNAPAIALYERCGFRRAGEFATMLF